jgi:hypothetical protein
MFLVTHVVYRHSGWTNLPLVVNSRNGMTHRLNTCVGCNEGYTTHRPREFVCDFQQRGFPLSEKDGSPWAVPCGVSYHGDCIQVGEPFRTRLPKAKGLKCPKGLCLPHFVCELCQVRATVERELLQSLQDHEVLAIERMRLIAVLNWWQQGTMQTYGPYLRFLGRFDNRYGTSVLEATRLHRPPSSSSTPLVWAQLLYSLRVHKGERIKFNTIRQIRSAAASYYTWDLHHVYPGRIRRERGRDTIRDLVSPSEEATMTFATKGMARRIGTVTKPSWALSFIHIEYIDRRLRNTYRRAQTPEEKH